MKRFFRIKQRLSRKLQVLLLIFSLTVLVFSVTGCSGKGSEDASPTSQRTEIPTNDLSDSHATSTTNEASSATVTQANPATEGPSTDANPPSPSTSSKSKEAVKPAPEKSAVTNKTPGSKIKPSPIPSAERKLTQDELRAAYPPAIGKVVPWYEPTAETVAKAFTSATPYEFGNNYALVKDGTSIILVYLAISKDGVGYWTTYTLKNIEINSPGAPAKFERNILTGTGMNGGILWLWSSYDNAWTYSNTVRLVEPEDPRYNMISQTWIQGKVIQVGPG